MNCLLLLLCLLAQTEKPAPLPGMPTEPGVYLRQGGAQWEKLVQVSMADMKTKGLGTYIDTGGQTNLAVTIVYQGTQAPLQIANPRPTFYVRGAGAAADAMIVRFTREKDRRTLQSDSSKGSLENRGGFNKREIQITNLSIFSDNSFTVTPQQDLKPGEYLLLFGFANTGFDFGFNPKRR